MLFNEKLKEKVELDTSITKELEEEGLVREFIRQIQQFRKESDFTPRDIGTLAVAGNARIVGILKKFNEHITSVAVLDKIIYTNKFGDGKKVKVGENSVTVKLTK